MAELGPQNITALVASQRDATTLRCNTSALHRNTAMLRCDTMLLRCNTAPLRHELPAVRSS